MPASAATATSSRARSPSEQLTLIESEELERARCGRGDRATPGESRRQLTTRGVRLNPLVGKRFRVGEVECLGIELCEPCSPPAEAHRP